MTAMGLWHPPLGHGGPGLAVFHQGVPGAIHVIHARPVGNRHFFPPDL